MEDNEDEVRVELCRYCGDLYVEGSNWEKLTSAAIDLTEALKHVTRGLCQQVACRLRYQEEHMGNW